MRNLKKFLAVVVAIAVMMTAMVPAFAAEATAMTDAKIVETLKVMQGNGGVTAEYLALDTQKVQLAIFLLRLMGKEAEARAYTDYKTNFTDAEKVGKSSQNLLGYLKDHPEYGFGGSPSGAFGVEEVAVPQMFYKVILTTMGYKCGDAATDDFKYADTLKFAKETAKISVAADLTKLTNNDVAKALVEALKANVKGGAKTFVQSLVDAKIVTEADAKTVGLIAEAASGATVKVTGAKKLTVTFDGAVDESKAAFTVKKGSITVNVATKTFAADKKSVVLELASKITAGEYNVSVSGVKTDAITAKVTAEEEKVGKITFPSKSATIARGNAFQATVSYKIFNQYEEDITNDYTNMNVNPGRGTESHDDGTITLTDATNDFNVDDVFVVSILDRGNNVFASETFKVVGEGKVAEIAIEKIVNTADTAKVITAGETDTNYALVLSLKDQYGNDVTNLTYLPTDISANISDTSVAQLNGYATRSVDGKDRVVLALTTPAAGNYKAGKATVTMVSTTTGKLATFTVEVKDVAKVDTITLEAPAYAAAGKDFDIPFTAVDQFGNEMKKAADLNAAGAFASKSIASSDDTTGAFPTGTKVQMTFVQDYVKNKAILRVDNHMTQKGTITVTFLTSTYKQVTLKIDVTDATVGSVVSGTKDFTANMVKDATSTLDFGDVIVKDQYAEDFGLTNGNMGTGAAGNYRIIVSSSDTGKVNLTGTDYDAVAQVYQYNDIADSVTLNGAAKGTATITVKLQKRNDGNTAWEDVKDSSYAFNSKVVEIADIASYEVAAFSKVYNDGSTTRGSDVTVNGILADGTKVVVDNTHYSVVSTDASVTYTGSKLTATTAIPGDDTSKDIDIIITVNANDGAKIFTPKLTVSEDAPVVEKISVVTDTTGWATVGDGVISVDKDNLTTGGANLQTLVKNAVKAEDQYGVELTAASTPVEPNYAIVVTNCASGDSSTLTVSSNASTAPTFDSAVIAGDNFNVTAVSNGKTVTFKVVVTD